MVLTVFAAAVALGLTLLAVMAAAQARQLRSSPPPPHRLPPVSILKPMKGADPALEANLESFFRLDYPAFELLFGVDDPGDPALAIARRVAAAHPEVPCRLVADRRTVGLNPKVNNLANLVRHAAHEVLWISDSNTRVAPDTLAALVAHLEQPGVGLVSSPFRGVAARGFGGACEALQLNTFVMGGVAAAHRLLHTVAVVGKSMLLRRSTLAAIGGCAFLGRFLAEDQVCGEEIARLGLRVELAGRPVENVLGALAVRGFLARHLRWARIRRRMNPAGYAAEILANPVFVALGGLLTVRTEAAVALFGAALLAKSAVDAVAERAGGGGRHLLVYPALTLAKDVLVGLAWAVPFVSATVAWRGHRFRLGPRTLLVPDAPDASVQLGPASAPARV